MGYVVLNIFRNHIPIMRSTYYMVMIATLPPELNVIAPGIHCDGPLKSAYHNRQCSTLSVMQFVLKLMIYCVNNRFAS